MIVDARRASLDLSRAVLGGGVPDALAHFDRAVRGIGTGPDFSEHSVAFGAELAPNRLTHYFDVRGRADAAEVADGFARVADALGYALPDGLAAAIRRAAAGDAAVEQVVFGFDAREEASATRLKGYLLFGATSAASVRAVAASADLELPSTVDADEVFLLGIDVHPHAAPDAKAYLRLDVARLPRTTINLREVAPLVEGARAVVLSQNLRDPARRQLHFHATDDARYAAWLDEQARSDPRVRALLDHARAVQGRLGGGRLAPWIVGLPHRDHRVATSEGNVYFHVT